MVAIDDLASTFQLAVREGRALEQTGDVHAREYGKLRGDFLVAAVLTGEFCPP